MTWTIDKCQCDVCWLRLDFDTFNILGTGATTETDGGVCLDDLTITVGKENAGVRPPLGGRARRRADPRKS